jgi:hypothetical protein
MPLAAMQKKEFLDESVTWFSSMNPKQHALESDEINAIGSLPQEPNTKYILAPALKRKLWKNVPTG